MHVSSRLENRLPHPGQTFTEKVRDMSMTSWRMPTAGSVAIVIATIHPGILPFCIHPWAPEAVRFFLHLPDSGCWISMTHEDSKAGMTPPPCDQDHTGGHSVGLAREPSPKASLFTSMISHQSSTFPPKGDCLKCHVRVTEWLSEQ
jgi:hypothetical protein